MIALVLLILTAVPASAKGRIIEGVVQPSRTLTVKSLIEAQTGDSKVVVCPKAVHPSIKYLTPCAMGYRAVVGKNRILVTHMWPARDLDEFYKRTGLAPLEPVASFDPPGNAVSLEDPRLKKEIEVLKQEKNFLSAEIIRLMERVKVAEEVAKKTQDLQKENETLRMENMQLQQQIDKLKAEVDRVIVEKAELQNSATSQLAAQKAETDDVRASWQRWKNTVIFFGIAGLLVLMLFFLRKALKAKPEEFDSDEVEEAEDEVRSSQQISFGAPPVEPPGNSGNPNQTGLRPPP